MPEDARQNGAAADVVPGRVQTDCGRPCARRVCATKLVAADWLRNVPAEASASPVTIAESDGTSVSATPPTNIEAPSDNGIRSGKPRIKLPAAGVVSMPTR